MDECTGCHQPLRGNDYVYTLPLTSATVKGGEVVNAGAAALPASLPFQPIAWRAITMYVDPQTRTMSTLFGNDAAMNSVDARRPGYEAGTVLALVTWAQREDPHWFGARIPGVPQSVEFVQSTPAGQSGYRRFGGSGFIEEHPDASVVTARTSFVLGLAPARLP